MEDTGVSFCHGWVSEHRAMGLKSTSTHSLMPNGFHHLLIHTFPHLISHRISDCMSLHNLKNRHQEGNKCVRILAGEISVRENGEELGKGHTAVHSLRNRWLHASSSDPSAVWGQFHKASKESSRELDHQNHPVCPRSRPAFASFRARSEAGSSRRQRGLEQVCWQIAEHAAGTPSVYISLSLSFGRSVSSLKTESQSIVGLGMLWYSLLK